ncbi:uncharacterized protein PHALS_15368 [Plasmopara halstedii]|uniref:Uncharacterized protein n=1 Tax=Plasmopara halstedii TaxID=4781 RepID=A0A0P1AF15_PLAHL|nr:uncharacterized protein PHALS_15368 [Plasmopara halstedii]CEG39266.1 hypothetical protein PHALS_15368 [Plasmopara halstedii]|eukprot:XP_024575635.1 hypothetical protein PHALS_15368 [Plasmopara halstedii]
MSRYTVKVDQSGIILRSSGICFVEMGSIRTSTDATRIVYSLSGCCGVKLPTSSDVGVLKLSKFVDI